MDELEATRKADGDIQAKVDSLRKRIIQLMVNQEGASIAADQKLQATSYATQEVPTGTNYFVKLQAGGDCVHARLFCELGNDAVALVGVAKAKANAPIEYF